MAKRALIFGCGYLGQRVARTWMESGVEVHAVTRSAIKAQSLRSCGIRPLIADVCEPASLTHLPEVDVVLHAIGFDRGSGRSQEEVTCRGTQSLLEAMKDRYSRLIHISSTSVYGQSTGEWVDETSECRPVQSGGQLALIAEQLVHTAQAATPGVQATILRLAGIYGPGRLLSRIESIKSGQPISGRGDSWLNLIHVDDAAAAVVKTAFTELPATTYLIVDDRPLPRADYYGILARLIGAPTPSFDPTQPAQRGSGGLNKRCSNRRAKEDLEWSPNYSSAESGLSASLAQSS